MKTHEKPAVARLVKTSVIAACGWILAGSVAAEGNDPTSEAPRPSRSIVATLPTHLGAPVADLITLSCLPTDAPDALSRYPHCTSFRQVDSAGAMAATDYTVAAGHTLVILDVDWESTFNGAGDTIFLNFSCTNRCAFIYSSSTVADVHGIAAHQDHLTAGLYVTYVPLVSTSGVHLSEVQLHGYLTQ